MTGAAACAGFAIEIWHGHAARAQVEPDRACLANIAAGAAHHLLQRKARRADFRFDRPRGAVPSQRSTAGQIAAKKLSA